VELDEIEKRVAALEQANKGKADWNDWRKPHRRMKRQNWSFTSLIRHAESSPYTT